MKTLRFHMTAMASDVPATAETVAQYCAAAGLDSKRCFEVKVAVAEALNNVVEHAFCGDNDNEQIEINCGTEAGSVVVTTIDGGKPIQGNLAYEFPSSETQNGRGWPILFSWMDSIEYCVENGLNHLVLRKYFDN